MPEVLKGKSKVETWSTAGQWSPTVVYTYENLDALRAEVAARTPSNAKLLTLAVVHAPPGDWWNETADPFASDETTE